METLHDMLWSLRLQDLRPRLKLLDVKPEEGRRWGYTDDPRNMGRIQLLLFKSSAYGLPVIPSDLVEPLRSFVPEPQAARPPAEAEPPEEPDLTIRVTVLEAAAELMALLRLAESGGLNVSDKTGLPSAAGIRKMLAVMPNGDFYSPETAFLTEKKSWAQEIGAIKPVGWARMLHTAGLVDVGSTKSKLTPKGMKALSEPPHETLRMLWRKWVTTPGTTNTTGWRR